MKRKFLVELEMDLTDAEGLKDPMELALWLEFCECNSTRPIQSATVWKTTDDYLADLEDGNVAEIV
ncbi:MAG: hypothetical protein IPH08_04055 [Rhodocyclaceae bacterium]|nr:hypothetical protein [Rhodocyclaceae bacterium]MBK6906306.1 hypothetical protein [Rhodocyclaceae bacterium]